MAKKKEPQFDEHHRVPRSKGGTDTPSNVILVRVTKHRAYHTLFENKGPHEVAQELNKTWIDPRYELVVVRKQ